MLQKPWVNLERDDGTRAHSQFLCDFYPIVIILIQTNEANNASELILQFHRDILGLLWHHLIVIFTNPIFVFSTFSKLMS